jgi:formylglycine-generating enzyme required for sulfatase activity
MKAFLAIALTLVACVLVGQSPPAPPAMEFVKIAPGEFMMGCSAGDIDCNDDEKPQHRVQITKPFEIGKYEVTQAQWQDVMGSNPSTMKGNDRPVETVTKVEAQDFLDRLNARNDGYHYRLPTEAEWEYAARAGTSDSYAGSLGDVAWYADNSEDETHPVGKKKPNAWGLYDMEGNVREWVADLYARNYYANSPVTDPTGPAVGAQGGGFRGRGGRGGPGGFGAPGDAPPPPGADGRRGGPGGGRRGGPGGPGRQLPIMRGGAWDTLATFVRVSARYNYYGPTLRVSDVGFRAAREAVAH